jgi:O-antigen/teichoic acid export membrane protein
LATGVVLGGRVAVQAVGLLLLIRLFDPSVYGRIASASTLAVLLGLLPSVGSGFILLARAPRGPSAMEDVWRYAWPMTLALGFLLGAGFVPLAQVLADKHSLPQSVLVLMAVSEILLMPLIGLASYALLARDRVPLSQILQSLPFGLRALAIALCFFVGDDEKLFFYATSQAVATAVAVVACLAIASRHFELAASPRLPTKSEISEGATYSAMHIVSANATELDKVFAIRLLGAYETGIYAAAGRVMVALMMPINAMLLAVQPRLFGHAHAPSESGHRLISTVGKLAAAWGVFAAVVLLALSAAVPALFGPEYAASAALMRWMALVAPLMGMRFAAGSVLVALGRPLDRLTFELAGILVTIAGLLAFAPFFGARGMVLAVGIAECVMLAIGCTMVLKRIRAEVRTWER